MGTYRKLDVDVVPQILHVLVLGADEVEVIVGQLVVLPIRQLRDLVRHGGLGPRLVRAARGEVREGARPRYRSRGLEVQGVCREEGGAKGGLRAEEAGASCEAEGGWAHGADERRLWLAELLEGRFSEAGERSCCGKSD